MEKKKSILFVMAGMNRGGAERSLINLLEMTDRERYDIDLLVFDTSGKLMAQIPKGVRVLQPDRRLICISTSSKKEMVENFSAKAVAFRLAYNFAKNKEKIPYIQSQEKWKSVYQPVLKPLHREYDIAVAYMHSLPSYYVIDKVNAKRKILWVHNDYSRLVEGMNFDRPYFEKADQVVTISEQCVRELEKAFPDLTDKFTCLYNLNPENKIREKALAFYPEEYRDCKGLKLISIGRLNYQKGFDYAVDAAKILKDKNVDFSWFIIGSGELRQPLEDQIRSLGMEKEVYLLGERENPYPYIQNADIVVQTSRFEGKSIVLDEAKILYKPIITTDYVSVRDQIEDGKSGMIVSLHAQAIADAIAKLYQNAQLCEELSGYLKTIPDVTAIVLQKYDSCFWGCKFEVKKKATIGVEKYEDFGNNI